MTETPHSEREGAGLPPVFFFDADADADDCDRSTLARMSEAPPASKKDLETLLAIHAVRIRMLKIAYSRARSVAAAKDLVQEVGALLSAGRSPWRPDPDRPALEQTEAFLTHVYLLVRRCHLDRVRRVEARRETELPEGFADVAGDGRMTHEEAAVDLEWEQEHERRATVWIDALRERMAKDDEALAVIAQHQRGVHEAEEQAKALGWKLARVVLAKRRIAYHAPIVRAQQLEAERQAEEARIAAAEAADKKRLQP